MADSEATLPAHVEPRMNFDIPSSRNTLVGIRHGRLEERSRQREHGMTLVAGRWGMPVSLRISLMDPLGSIFRNTSRLMEGTPII